MRNQESERTKAFSRRAVPKYDCLERIKIFERIKKITSGIEGLYNDSPLVDIMPPWSSGPIRCSAQRKVSGSNPGSITGEKEFLSRSTGNAFFVL